MAQGATRDKTHNNTNLTIILDLEANWVCQMKEHKK
jgi:hypothetical protein